MDEAICNACCTHTASVCNELRKRPCSRFSLYTSELQVRTKENIHTSDTSGQHNRQIFNLCILSPGTHKVEVTGGVVVGNVPSKLRDAGLVVVSVLGVELHVAVAEQKHQLCSKDEADVKGKNSQQHHQKLGRSLLSFSE